MPEGTPSDPLDPQFLIEHAERLTTSTGPGRPPTIDARRAASAAYYAAYHAVSGAVSRMLFGEEWLAGVRLLTHKGLFDASRLVSRLGPHGAADPGADPARMRDLAVWRIFQEVGGAKDDLLEAMEVLRALKEAREMADYDRAQGIPHDEARELVGQAARLHAFFNSPRISDADTKAFFALAALRA